MYQFEREVLEDMVKEEHDRIKNKLEQFGEKLKKHNVSLSWLPFRVTSFNPLKWLKKIKPEQQKKQN